jgi:hypothetical protein
MTKSILIRLRKNLHFVTIATVLGFVVILGISVASSSDPQQKLTDVGVENKTSSFEVSHIQRTNRSVHLSLLNNGKKNITAFAVSRGNTTIRVDLTFNDSPVAPGAVYEFDFPMQTQSGNSTPANSIEPAIIVQAAVFDDRSYDGDPKIAGEFAEARVAQKKQLTNIISLIESAVKSSGPKTALSLQRLKEQIASLPDGLNDALSMTTRSELSGEKEMAIREVQKIEQSSEPKDEASILNALLRMKEDYKELAAKL